MTASLVVVPYDCSLLTRVSTEVCCVLVSAAWCALYVHVGLLSRSEARLVALCALPRSLDTRECCTFIPQIMNVGGDKYQYHGT